MSTLDTNKENLSFKGINPQLVKNCLRSSSSNTRLGKKSNNNIKLISNDYLVQNTISIFLSSIVFILLNLKFNISYYLTETPNLYVDKDTAKHEILKFTQTILKNATKNKILVGSKDIITRSYASELLVFTHLIKYTILILSVYCPLHIINMGIMTFEVILIILLFSIIILINIILNYKFKQLNEKDYYTLKKIYFISIFSAYIISSFHSLFIKNTILSSFRTLYFNLFQSLIIFAYLNSKTNIFLNVISYISVFTQIILIQAYFYLNSIPTENFFIEHIFNIGVHALIQFLSNFGSTEKNSENLSTSKIKKLKFKEKEPVNINDIDASHQHVETKFSNKESNKDSSTNSLLSKQNKLYFKSSSGTAVDKTSEKEYSHKYNNANINSLKSVVSNPKIKLSDDKGVKERISNSDDLQASKKKNSYITMLNSKKLLNHEDNIENRNSSESSYEKYNEEACFDSGFNQQNLRKKLTSNYSITNLTPIKNHKDDAAVNRNLYKHYSITSKDLPILNLIPSSISVNKPFLKYLSQLPNVGLLIIKLQVEEKTGNNSLFYQADKEKDKDYNLNRANVIFNNNWIIENIPNCIIEKDRSTSRLHSTHMINNIFDITIFKSFKYNKIYSEIIIPYINSNLKNGSLNNFPNETLLDLVSYLSIPNQTNTSFANKNDYKIDRTMSNISFSYKTCYIYTFNSFFYQVFISIENCEDSIQMNKSYVNNNIYSNGIIMLTMYDVTPLIKKMELDMKLTEEKDRLGIGFTHDLKSGLTAVSNICDVLELEYSVDLKLKENFDTMGSICNHLFYLVNNHLQVIRALRSEAMNLEIIRKSVDLKAILEFCFKILNVLIKHKSSKLNVKPELIIDDKITTLTVLSDSERLKQILINFISNAFKFTHKGKIQIICEVRFETTSKDIPNLEDIHKFGRLTLGNQESSEVKNSSSSNSKINNVVKNEKLLLKSNSQPLNQIPYIVIIVRDEGEGMDSDTLGKIRAGLFSDLHIDRESNPTGTGIGLKFTKNILDMLDYEFEIDSVKGKGTEIKMIIKNNITKASESTIKITSLKSVSDTKKKRLKTGNKEFFRAYKKMSKSKICSTINQSRREINKSKKNNVITPNLTHIPLMYSADIPKKVFKRKQIKNKLISFSSATSDNCNHCNSENDRRKISANKSKSNIKSIIYTCSEIHSNDLVIQKYSHSSKFINIKNLRQVKKAEPYFQHKKQSKLRNEHRYNNNFDKSNKELKFNLKVKESEKKIENLDEIETERLQYPPLNMDLLVNYLQKRKIEEQRGKDIILIVDDNPMLVKQLVSKVESIIGQEGLISYQIITGCDGVDIIYRVISDQNEEKLKCIITDESMDFINASTSIKIIKSLKFPNNSRQLILPPIICCSGYEKENFEENTFNYIVKKDVKKEDLKLILQEIKLI